MILVLSLSVALFLDRTQQIVWASSSEPSLPAVTANLFGAPASTTVYLSDYQADVVLYYPTSGQGIIFVPDIPEPTGMAFDSSGTLYISSDNLTEPPPYEATIYTVPPGGGSKEVFYSSPLLEQAHGLVFDKKGNLFVATASGDTILEFKAPFGNPVQAPIVYQDASNGLAQPTALAFDNEGTLYVSNVFGTNRTSILTFNRPHQRRPGRLPSPLGGYCNAFGLAFDSTGALYVSNAAAPNHCAPSILKYDPVTQQWSTFVAAGGSDLEEPLGIAIDQSNNDVYVADRKRREIYKFDQLGNETPFGPGIGSPHFIALRSE